MDTNTANNIIKGSIPAVRRRLVKVPMAHISILAVIEGELRYGVARRPDAARLETVVQEFLLRVTIHAWDSDAAQQYGRLRAALERGGHSMGNLDMMIAAHALPLGVVLVTHDQAFARVKKLKIQGWTKS